ncbi:MAG TPA: NUDIX domain-containing protein [Burkholderiaceae bacterium]
MISFPAADWRFHLRAAAILRHGDAVLLHRIAGDAFWSLPGGRVEAGETAAEAVQREMREELDTEVECVGLVAIVENFFDYRGRAQHGIELHFELRLPPGSPLVGLPAFERIETGGGLDGDAPPLTLEFRWFRPHELDALDLRPAALRPLLARPAQAGIAHLVNADRVRPA